MPSSSSHLAAAVDLFVAPSCTSYYCANRYEEYVSNTIKRQSCAVPFFQRTVIFVYSWGHIETKSYLVRTVNLCVCVCATHRLSRATLVFVHVNSRASGTCHPTS